MSVYLGLDVYLDAVAMCVVGETGKMLWQGQELRFEDATELFLHSRSRVVIVSSDRVLQP